MFEEIRVYTSTEPSWRDESKRHNELRILSADFHRYCGTEAMGDEMRRMYLLRGECIEYTIRHFGEANCSDRRVRIAVGG